MKLNQLQQLITDWGFAKSDAHARQLGGWLDDYVHTLPPNERQRAVKIMTRLWLEHYSKWIDRIDSAEATDAERHLIPADWKNIEIILTQLLVDINGQRDTHQ